MNSPKSNNSIINQLGSPRNNFQHMKPIDNIRVQNYDPQLGGNQFKVPAWSPNCPFLNAVKETP